MLKTPTEMREVIARCVDGDKEARAELWTEVERFVTRVAHLRKLGRLAQDPDVKRDVFLAVMATVDNEEHQRNFLEMGDEGPNFWQWVQVRVNSRAIDLVRSHDDLISPRGKPYQWRESVPLTMMVKGTDPGTLSEVERALADVAGRNVDTMRLIEACEYLRKHATDQRAVEAFLYRLMGHTWEKVAEELAYPSAAAVRMAALRMTKEVSAKLCAAPWYSRGA